MRRQILSRSLLTVAAASSILAVTGGYANAEPDTHGSSNGSRQSADAHAQEADSGESYSYGATVQGTAQGSPGVLSGNSLSVPIEAPVNVCGNSVDVAALLNSASGNSCANREAPRHTAPPAPHVRTPAAQVTTPEVHLAETGSSRGTVGAATGAGAVLLLGGAMLYRRSTRTARIRRTYS